MTKTRQLSPISSNTTEINEVLERLADMLSRKAATPSVTFSGSDLESPSEFIDTLDAWFKERGVADVDQVNIAIECLRGDASTWATQYQGIGIGWKTLADQLRRKWESTAAITRLKSRLYGTPQDTDESVAPFILRKMALFRRLEPTASEESRICVVTELLHPRFRPYLRGHTVSSVNRLLEICTSIEGDLGPIVTARPQQRAVPSRAVQSNPSNSAPINNVATPPVTEPQPVFTEAAITPSDAPVRVDVIIDDRPCHALIDTGAAANVIRDHGAMVCPAEVLHLELAASNQKMCVLGQTTAEIRIAGKPSEVEFLVSPDLHEEVILGQPWLAQEEATIDFKQRCIHFGRHPRTTAYWSPSPAPGAAPASARTNLLFVPKDVEGARPEPAPDEFTLLRRIHV